MRQSIRPGSDATGAGHLAYGEVTFGATSKIANGYRPVKKVLSSKVRRHARPHPGPEKNGQRSEERRYYLSRLGTDVEKFARAGQNTSSNTTETLRQIRQQLFLARDNAGKFPDVGAMRWEINPMQKLGRSTHQQKRVLGVDVRDEQRREK